LIVQRSAALAFAAGAYVFPGGRVDPVDEMVAARSWPGFAPGDGAARLAALRETMEETAIVAGEVGGLVPFARWLPKEQVVRRFDTRFYLAEAGAAGEPVADGTETASAFWASAEDVLARCRAGEGRAIFPTRRLLERLARFASFAEARAEAERLPERIITPWIEERPGGAWLCIPGDAGYPITEEQIDSALRY